MCLFPHMAVSHLFLGPKGAPRHGDPPTLSSPIPDPRGGGGGVGSWGWGWGGGVDPHAWWLLLGQGTNETLPYNQKKIMRQQEQKKT